MGVVTLGTLVVYHQLALKAGLSRPTKVCITKVGKESVRELIPAHHINKQTSKQAIAHAQTCSIRLRIPFQHDINKHN